MADKPLVWMGSSLASVRGFPPDARARAGYKLRRVQGGLPASDWKPVAAVGPGACEVRIHTALEHRILYVAKFAEAVYVLHAFEKRTQKVPLADLEIARRRYASLLNRRAARKEH